MGLMFKWSRRVLLMAAIVAAVLWGISMYLQPKPIGPPVAPVPAEHREAVVQVYGADVWGVRGLFAIHTWLAVKAPDAATYDIYQVIGWRQSRGSVVSVTQGMPNRPWFRSPPVLLHEVTGPSAEALIEPIEQSVRRYPFADRYVMWPGPNSNSFIQWIALDVPQLGFRLPDKAIGKNWMRDNYERYQSPGVN